MLVLAPHTPRPPPNLPLLVLRAFGKYNILRLNPTASWKIKSSSNLALFYLFIYLVLVPFPWPDFWETA